MILTYFAFDVNFIW